ncbi:MAG: hemolysin family protein [Bifidobacteriaceae bacterium]|jgi:CBS domain containing-hemolysin-like protein|nr:hemolysin family protein [Bifidobacteriaceae bacterium]
MNNYMLLASILLNAVLIFAVYTLYKKYKATKIDTTDFKKFIDSKSPVLSSVSSHSLQMIGSIYDLQDTIVREVMVPRTDLETVDFNASVDDVYKFFMSSGFSRIPVIGEDIDDVIGIVYLKDVVKELQKNPKKKSTKVDSIARPAHFVPEFKLASELLIEMQNERNHISLVIDEFGGVAGLVTLEDIIEEILGELVDEHDKVQQHSEPEQLSENVWRIPARLPIDDLCEMFDLGENENDSIDTALGLISSVLQSVPKHGDEATYENLKMKVDYINRKKQIVSLIVEKLDDSSDAEEMENNE